MREPLSMPVQIVLCLALLVGLGAVWTHRDAGLRMLGVSVAAPSPPSDATAGPPAVPVIVAEVGAARDRVSFEAVGTGRANRSVMLRAESEGKVAEMAIAPGRRFEAGETLIRLDDRVERIALSLAETRLAEAERVLDRDLEVSLRGAAT